MPSGEPTKPPATRYEESDAIPIRPADTWEVDRDPGHLRIQFTTNTEHLRPVRMAIEAFCRESDFDEKSWSEIGFVVNEAVANIIRHAYHAEQPMPVDLPVDLTATLSPNEITIELRDWGHGIVPPPARGNRARSSGSSESLPEPGGIGLLCMKQLMDEVNFVPQRPGMLLRMSKKRSHDSRPDPLPTQSG